MCPFGLLPGLLHIKNDDFCQKISLVLSRKFYNFPLRPMDTEEEEYCSFGLGKAFVVYLLSGPSYLHILGSITAGRNVFFMCPILVENPFR